MLMALVFLQETVTSLNAVGILLIVTGVVVLSLTKGGDVRGWRLRDLAFPISAAVAYSAGNVVRRYGFIVTPASTLEAIALNETAATLTLGTYLLVTRRDRLSAGNRSPLPFFVLAGVFSASGLFALFHALSLGEVTVVDPISGMATLFATLFSYFLLRDVELVTRGVVVGAMLVVVGGVAVTL
jgi:uncharacterized membrane protein